MKNEPAFPMFKPRIENYCQEEVIPGMTLRDYFAAKAMNGMLTRFWVNEEGRRFEVDQNWLATNAYRYADAMLAERSRDNEE